MSWSSPHRRGALWALALAAAMAVPWLPAAAQVPATPPSLVGEVERVAQWAKRTHDAQGMPFAIIDKKGAAVHVFDGAGRLRASSAILLGLTRGDQSVPGIGEREMSQIAPHERTTPAGRFMSEPGRNVQGEDIVWIDYDAAVSMHRVRANNKAERRLERLASPTVEDNRISYGCVNLPAAFYDAHVKPLLGSARGVIYVLPEMPGTATVWGKAAALAE